MCVMTERENKLSIGQLNPVIATRQDVIQNISRKD